MITLTLTLKHGPWRIYALSERLLVVTFFHVCDLGMTEDAVRSKEMT